MKKELFTMLLLINCLASAFSQANLQSTRNMPRPDDILIKQQVSYKDPGRSGENVLWDFSLLNTINEEYKLKYSALGDSAVIGTEHQTMYYYQLRNDSLLLHGFENSTTLMLNSQPEVLLKFPVRYGDQIRNYFRGQGRYCDRLHLDAMGTIETKADASGMIILPNGDTLKHILRTHTLKRIAEEMIPFSSIKQQNIHAFVSTDSIDLRLQTDTLIMEIETYRWYEQGYRYPVFETVKTRVFLFGIAQDYFDTAFFYPPQDHYYIEDDMINQTVLEALEDQDNNPVPTTNNPWEGLTYNFYPNPVVTNMDVEMYLPRPAKIRVQLSDRQGRLILEENWGSHLAGTFTKQVFMSPYVQGEYVLNIWLDDYMVSGKILKR